MYSGTNGMSGTNGINRLNSLASASLVGGANRQAIPGIANVGNYKAQEDWWFFIPAIIFVDTVLIFLVRFFPETFGKPLNQWYDEFGLAAVLSDVTIFAIVIVIARYIYTVFFMEQEGWSIWYFIGLAIAIQMVHDLLFAFGIDKAKVNKGALFLFNQLHYVSDGFCHANLLNK
jgi:hypothetical protein